MEVRAGEEYPCGDGLRHHQEISRAQAEPYYRADFGVTSGDVVGTDINLRSCWSNPSTGLVDDIPGEIMLSPAMWGDLTVEP